MNIDQTLSHIKTLLNNNEKIIPINFLVNPTKGKSGVSTGQLYIDKKIENDVSKLINERISFPNINERYLAFDPTAQLSTWPRHYPSRFIEMRGTLAEGKNIFLIFPLALGRAGKQESDYFGFEFIDVWEKVFNTIVFPCAQVTLTPECQNDINVMLKSSLSKTIYLASLLHEIGHRTGSWKVIPKKDERVKLSRLYMDILCELETDTLLNIFFPEFPELKYFTILQRIFWFGRFGFSKETINGEINFDNDAFIGIYLWMKLNQHGCITYCNQKITINFTHTEKMFRDILNELTQLKSDVVATSTMQENMVTEWMKSTVPFSEEQFVIPENLKNIFNSCLHIPTRVTL